MNAKQARCVSNVRQLATAFMMYAVDYDGHVAWIEKERFLKIMNPTSSLFLPSP